jgi:uncharacterized protein YcaQ
MTLHLDNSTARRVLLHLQGLSGRPDRALSDDGLLDLIQQLGLVQMDSISHVERAHHMILHARNTTYRPKQLSRIAEKSRGLFEHWTHDASFLPTQFFPSWRHRFARDAARLEARFAGWQGDGFRDHLRALLDRVAEHGPLRSRDLAPPPAGEPRGMWQWHDGKTALEYLWRTGVLGITRREGFQKVYDLMENCIPAQHFDARVDEDTFIDWCCDSALARLGFGQTGDIARYWDHLRPAEVAARLAGTGGDRLIPVRVEGIDGSVREMVGRPDLAEIVANLPEPPRRVRVLSPFDPIIRDRKRLSWLFGFDYRIEIYVPAEQRQWGYYVFPLLESERIVGRIDMRADRKNDRLEVRRLWWEPKLRGGAGRFRRLEAELERQARFAGVSSVHWLPGAFGD